MNKPDEKKIYVSCVPGLEPYLFDECASLGFRLSEKYGITEKPALIQGNEEEKGGIEFSGNDREIYLANLNLRTASRVIVRLGEFYAAAFSELRKKASRLPWEQYLIPGQNVDLKVTCHKSRLYHSDAVAERIRGAIEDHFKHPLNPLEKETKKILVQVRLTNDLCTISIDSSGELLHKRGYRLAVAKAPLRETLAAGILLASKWQPGIPLIDPFCGSGTIPIEAALISRGIIPGIHRRFAFMNWSSYNPDLFSSLLEKAKKEIHSSDSLFYAADRDRGAIEMATANAARTGVNQDIHFACHALSDLPDFSKPGWFITNPPYGIRVSSSKDLRNLYSSFGKMVRERFATWNLAVLCNDPILIHSLDLRNPDQAIPLINGGIPVKLYIFHPQEN